MYQNSPYQNQPHGPQQQPSVQYQLIDERHGLAVYAFAHPAGWRAAGKVMWNMEHTNVPAQVYAVAFNPQGVESFEFLPMQAFYWMESDTVAVGQNRHGLVRMQPRAAHDAMLQLVIPHFRGDRQGLRIVGAHPVANLWQATNDPPPQNQAQCVVARVEYVEQGRPVEEEFYGVCEWVPATGGALNWGFGRLFCFRAERGQLERLRPTFWQIAGSLRLNPQWTQLCNQVAQQLMSGVVVRERANVESIYAASEQGRRNIIYNDQLLAQRSAQVEASVRQTHQQIDERSRSAYTTHDAFGDALMDRNPYHDPNSAAGNYHYVQGQYNYVYTDNQGNFYPTNDPSDNPNHHLPGHWVEATPVKRNS